MSTKVADVFGVLSLLCWAPFLTLVAPGGWGRYPDGMFAVLFWSLIGSPFAGVMLAGIAGVGRRTWLVLAGVWAVALAYGWWDMVHHPFDL